MNLQAIARSALATIAAAVPESTVTVVYNGQTCQGLKDTQTDLSGMTTMGEQGATTGIVRVDASQLAAPKRGATMILNGKNVFVTNHKLDTAGAMRRIEYSEQRPVVFTENQ